MTDPHAAWNTTVRDHIDRLEARIARQEEQLAEAFQILNDVLDYEISDSQRIRAVMWIEANKD